MTVRRPGVLGVVCAVLALAGCGGSSHSSSSSSLKSNATPNGSTAGSQSTPTTTSPTSGEVAIVSGQPITRLEFTHWLTVAAKSAGVSAGGKPAVVPADPPEFTGCVAQARHQYKALVSRPTATLRTDCARLFRTMMPQVMDFLIKGQWYLGYGTANHVTVTDAAVQQAFTRQKAAQFHSDNGYQAFLTETGQTQQDILFRVKISQVYGQLLARQPGSTTARAGTLDRRLHALYQSQTVCATGFTVAADCG